MKHFFQKTYAVLLATLTLTYIKLANAAPISSGETIISKPVGAGILPGGGTEGEDIRSSIIFAKVIPFLITWAINLAIALSVIVIIIGGYLYATSYGDDEKKQRGTRAITYALIGLILAITAYGIVYVITSIQLS